MRRLLTHALLALALFGVVTGSLLKPCDCGAVEAVARGGCERGSSPASACCCCDDVVQGASQPKDDGSFKLCHKPRPPLGEPEVSAGLDVPVPSMFLLAFSRADATLSGAWARVTSRPWTDEHRRPSDPWRISPEGLGLFLI